MKNMAKNDGLSQQLQQQQQKQAFSSQFSQMETVELQKKIAEL
jgi:hypothetical protein